MVTIGMKGCNLGVEGAKAVANLVMDTPALTEVRTCSFESTPHSFVHTSSLSLWCLAVESEG